MNQLTLPRYETIAKSPDALESKIKTMIFLDIEETKSKFPQMSQVIKSTEEIVNSHYFDELIYSSQNEFSLDTRGLAWADNATKGLLVRQNGVQDILRLANPNGSLCFNPNFIIGDFLAGDGFINQVSNRIIPEEDRPSFINSDVSYLMYGKAKNHRLFSCWQDAKELFWVENNSLDAAIFAYGTHHIEDRLQAVKEAHRVLKKGGRFVLHDFEVGSSVVQWFANVVSCYSTPHPYPHFTKTEMLNLAQQASFNDIKIQYIDDPFVITAKTEEKAINLLGQYVINLYGLQRIDTPRVIKLLEQYFSIHTKRIKSDLFESKIIRNALVLSATKG